MESGLSASENGTRRDARHLTRSSVFRPTVPAKSESSPAVMTSTHFRESVPMAGISPGLAGGIRKCRGMELNCGLAS